MAHGWAWRWAGEKIREGGRERGAAAAGGKGRRCRERGDGRGRRVWRPAVGGGDMIRVRVIYM